MKFLRWLKGSEAWLTIAVVAMLAYQLFYTRYFLYDPGMHRITFLGFSFIVVFLAALVAIPKIKSVASKIKRLFLVLLLLVGIGLTVQLLAIYPKSLTQQFLPLPQAMVAGTIALIFCFALTWWRIGKVFGVVILLAFAYVILGPYILPEDIQPPRVSLLRLLAWTAGDIVSDQGVYGSILSFLANYMWLLMLLGSFLQAFGGLRFIEKIGMLASTRLASGPAALSVVTSSLVGMVTGVTAANIAITGSFTIPMMKQRGYTREQAAGIEEAASNGGQIMPPIMGVTAFILAEFIGIPYIKVTYHAYIPAFIYFFCVFLYVQLQAMKRGFTPLPPVKISGKELLLDAPLFILPLLVLVLLMIKGNTLVFTSFWAIITVIGTGLISSLARKKARIDWKEARQRLVGGAVSACDMAIIAGLLGALTGILEMSGLAFMIGEFFLKLSGGNLFLLLMFTAITCLILGTGLPTITAYVLTAMVLAPPLIALGVPVLAAHMFIFVYAISANVTPPIGIGIIVAQRIAGGTFWGTAWEGVKACFVTFFLPFFFIYAPAVMLLFEGLSVPSIIMHLLIALLFTMSVSFVLSDYCLAKLSLPEKMLFGVGGLLPLLALAFKAQGWLLVTIALAAFLFGLMLSRQRSRVLSLAVGSPGDG
ncbi:MAG: TRAP transporter fused permease subunit [Chloroflexi bacterium]|nr:TRAP transporter fused permease subunit [Chloroflexota bacterium]